LRRPGGLFGHWSRIRPDPDSDNALRRPSAVDLKFLSL
jgi:hypothetical protein